MVKEVVILARIKGKPWSGDKQYLVLEPLHAQEVQQETVEDLERQAEECLQKARALRRLREEG